MALAVLLQTNYLVPGADKGTGFADLVQFALWGNQADLSLHNDPGKKGSVNLGDLQKQSRQQLEDHRHQ